MGRPAEFFAPSFIAAQLRELGLVAEVGLYEDVFRVDVQSARFSSSVIVDPRSQLLDERQCWAVIVEMHSAILNAETEAQETT